MVSFEVLMPLPGMPEIAERLARFEREPPGGHHDERELRR